jgi:hypothetical protein
MSCETLDLNKLLLLQNNNKLSENKIIAGLKQALENGVTSATDKLSEKNGFFNNKSYKIQTPKNIKPVTDTMRKIGLGSLVDSFDEKMNSAAEKATASAGPVFIEAIMEMNFQDAKKILYGKNTEATEYLKKHTYKKLLAKYKPIISKSIKEVGAGQIYSNLMDKYDALPFKSKPKFSLENYVAEKSLDAIFDEIAIEEQRIRTDPKARTTELLKEVFKHLE